MRYAVLATALCFLAGPPLFAAQPTSAKKPSKIRPVGYVQPLEGQPCETCGTGGGAGGAAPIPGACPNCDGCGDCGNCCNSCLCGPAHTLLPCLFRKAVRSLDCLLPCGCHRPGKNLLDLSHFRVGCYECQAHGACLHQGCNKPCGCSTGCGSTGVVFPPPAVIAPDSDDPFKDDPQLPPPLPSRLVPPPAPENAPQPLPPLPMAPPQETRSRYQNYWKTPYAAGQAPRPAARAPIPAATAREQIERQPEPPLKVAARAPHSAPQPTLARRPVQAPSPTPVASGPARFKVQDESEWAAQTQPAFVRQASLNTPATAASAAATGATFTAPLDAPPAPPAAVRMATSALAPQAIPVNPLRSSR